MEHSQTHSRTIALGKAIVERFKGEPCDDILTDWMAHYISEKVVEAENSEGKSKADAEKCCFETIVKLWKHRWTLAPGRRPLEDFLPVLEALNALHSNNPRIFFSCQFDSHSNHGQFPTAEEQLVQLITDLDRSARILIEWVLTKATETACHDENREILHNIPITDDDFDVRAIRILLTSPSYGKDQIRDFEIRELKKKVTLLNTLSAELNKMKKELRSKLATLKAKGRDR